MYQYLTDVYFQLNGVNYSNNSIVNITDIGEGVSDSLLCFTNNTNCCESPRRGEWYFPNMSIVRIKGEDGSFYRDRGPSVVRLHRRHNATMPTGPFCCEIPDANNVTHRIYITVDTSTTSTFSFTASTATTVTEVMSQTKVDMTYTTTLNPSKTPVIPIAASGAAILILFLIILILICIILLR